MTQYQHELTQEIDELERAKALLKDETVSQRNEILKVINPLHIISRVSLRTLEKTQYAMVNRGLDELTRIELSMLDKSQMSLLSKNQVGGNGATN